MHLVPPLNSPRKDASNSRKDILLGGGGSQIRSLGIAIEEALKEYGGGKVTTVEEPQYAGSNGALKIALDMPEDYWKEFQTNMQAAAEEEAAAE